MVVHLLCKKIQSIRLWLWFLFWIRLAHPRRPSGSQSGQEKRHDESFQAQAEELLGTDSHRTTSKRSSECWLLIGHKKMLCIIVPNRRTVSFEFFFVSSYTAAIISPQLPGSFTKLS